MIGLTQLEGGYSPGNAITAILEGSTGEPDQQFVQDLMSALALEGIHVDPSHLSSDQLNALIQKAWSDPAVQGDWQSGVWDVPTTYGGAGNFSTYLRKALFDDPNSDLIQDGLSLKQQQGQTLTASEIHNLGPLSQQVPTPFDPQFAGDTTLTFGQTGPFGAMEDGIDYGMPVGTAIYSPFAGTIVVENKGKADWGTRVMVKLDNGYTFAVGHLTNAAVTTGERVNPGEIIGESGGDPSDPNSGESSGPHVEVQWINPSGQFTDPSGIMGQIYGGVTFGSLGLASAAGTGVSTTDAKDRLLGIDPVLNAKYAGFVSIWKKYFGTEPTVSQTLAMAAHGPSVNQVEDFIRAMPGPFAGPNMGQYFDLRSLADNTMNKLLGHAATDGVVQRLWQSGNTDPGGVQHELSWLSENAVNAMGRATYDQIRQANAPSNMGIYNEGGFDPQVAVDQHQQAGSPPPSATPVTTATGNLDWQAGSTGTILDQLRQQPLQPPPQPVTTGGSQDAFTQ